MDGEVLIAELIAATGLPRAWVEPEFDRLLQGKGLRREQMTLDLLREILAELMQDVLVDTKLSLQQL
jgi:hypothetical protein